MADSRLTLTIEARNHAESAFKQLQADVRQSNQHLERIAQNTQKVTRNTAQLTQSQQIVKRLRSEYNFLRTEVANTAVVTSQFTGVIQRQIRAQVDAAANIERLRVGLVSLSGDVSKANLLYRELVEVSRLPGINIENSLRSSLQLQALDKDIEETIEIIREFGNALALSGTPPRELNQVINAIRQMSGEGKIIQEDIAILTTRVAALIPHLKEAFGGTRAEDVREFFDALGVDESEQADRFLRIMLNRLKELPRAGETAANAIENLGDTNQRVQATIGAHFLPIVKETTAALEGLLMEIEREPQVAKTIAILEGMAGSFLTVTAAGTALAAALPAVIAAVGSLGAPVLAPIAVVGGLAAAFVGLRIAAEEIETPAERLSEVIEQNAESIRELNRAAADSQNIRQLRQAQEQLISDQQALQGELKRTKTDLTEAQEALNNYITQRRTPTQGIDSILPVEDLQLRDLPENDAQLQNLQTQLTILAKRYAELQEQVIGFASAGAEIKGALDPLVETQVNVENLTKSIADLKEELQEEVTFEEISRNILGEDVDFRKSATALADIQSLVALNAESFEDLGKAAASGNQEAIDTLAKLNKELDGLRDAQADRHITNLSTAFADLTVSSDASRKQFESILTYAEAFVNTFQGASDVLQDDVARALELIGNVRDKLKEITEDERTLELHDEGAERLSQALLDFNDLQRDVQEATLLNARRSAEQQATAYIRAYRDTIDPAILHLVESVKILRAEVRESIQDLEALNRQDQITLDVRGEIGGEQSDALAELFDLNQAVQGDLTRNQINNLNQRAEALKTTLADETLSLQRYVSDVESIQEQLTDKRFSLLEGEVQARQAAYEDDLRNQRQVEDAKQKKYEETHDFTSYLLGLRRDSLKEARAELTRLEERALDASSQRQRENLIRETQQFVDAYAERGEAFRDLVNDATQLGEELQQAFDLSEQTKRLEDFRDGLAGVFDDLIGITFDHFWDSFTDGSDRATEAFGIFTDRVRGDFELLENDVTRLDRQVEDFTIRLSRIGEDEERRVRQLERQRRALLARASTGDQRDAERTRQRSQDISFRISELRENFAVRRQRAQEDADRRRNRAIADALQRRDRFESRQSDEGLLAKLLESLTSSLSNTLSSTLSDVIAGALAGALGGQFSSLLDTLKGLFTGSGDGGQQKQTSQTSDTTQQQQGEADVDGTINALKLSDPPPTAPLINVTATINALKLSEPPPTLAVDVSGRITKAELSEGARLPALPGLKGGLSNVILQQNAQLPIVPGLTGTVGTLDLAETIEDLPNIVGLEGRIDSLTLFQGEDGIDLPTISGLTGTISALALSEPPPAVPLINLTGTINDLSFAEGVTAPALPSQALMINSVAFSDDIDYPNIPSQVLNISGIAFLEGVTPPTLPSQGLMIDSVKLSEDIDYPSLPNYEALITSVKLIEGISLPSISLPATAVVGTITGGQTGQSDTSETDEDPENPQLIDDQDLDLTGTITSAILDPDIDLPTITGLDGRIDSITVAGDVDLSTIRIPATAVVGAMVGGQFRGVDTDEDPENPMLADVITPSLDLSNITQPVELSGVINATLNKLFEEPIVLQGRIDATVNYLTGAGIDQDEGGRGGGGGRPANRDEDPVQRSQVAQDLSTIARVLENAAVSGNLDPSKGPTPQVDIPTPNLDIDTQPTPGATHPQGFGDALGNANQFAPRAGGSGRAGGLSGALRVTFPTEVLSKLAQEETLSKHFVGTNQHLAVMRTFIANDMFPAINTQLAAIAENTRVLTEIPLVEALAVPSAPGLEDVPVGLQDKSVELLDTLQQLSAIASPAPNLAETPGSSEGNPMYMYMTNQREVQDVRLVGGKIESVGSVDSVGEIRKQVNVKQVGTIAVTQSGEWVMRLASGGTIPVYVEGGRIVADIEGGLEGLAVSLADEEVGLRAVGAL